MKEGKDLLERAERLRNQLLEMGASLVSFADLRALPAHTRDGFDYAIAIAAVLDPAIINGIGNGPTQAYYDEYYKNNRLLDNLAMKAAEIIEADGFKVLPKTRANVHIDGQHHSTILPHKTVATRAGLGWIGKCALLVTEKYGPTIRVTSVLTNAPLPVSEPINHSKCGTCDACVKNCPQEALSGDLWSAEMERAQFYNHLACRKGAVERAWKIAPGETHCGLCVLVCPWTRRYIASLGIDYNFPTVDVASKSDLEEILKLQKRAYQEEAAIYQDYTIAPLTQSLEELQAEASYSIVLKLLEDRKIVGSVRAYEKEGTCYIGRLMVDPDYQNRGYGKKLMAAVETAFEDVRYELFTGHKSEKNLAFYQQLGYKEFNRDTIQNIQLVYLQK